MVNINSIKERISKGCGKESKVKLYKRNVFLICGEDNDLFSREERFLCPLCKTKLQILTEVEQEIENETKEKIMEVKCFFHTHPNANFTDDFLFGVDEGLDKLREIIK